MAVSQNGWQVINSVEKCKQWVIPGFEGPTIPLRPGPAGFILVHWTLWFHQVIESLEETRGDDFGWAYRQISGSDEWSNHASGTAVDLNAALHPQGRENSFRQSEVDDIHERLLFFNNVIKWGGDFRSVKDEMHFEIQGTHTDVTDLARLLHKTPRGKRITRLN